MKAIFLQLVLICVIFSCKKDETPTQILQKHNWLITGETISPAVNINGTNITDVYVLLNACARDNFIHFNSDKTITQDEGASKCNTTDPQTKVAGKWDLSSDAKNLYLTDTDLSGLTGTLQGVVNKLDNTELNVTISNVKLNSSTVALTLKFTPK